MTTVKEPNPTKISLDPKLLSSVLNISLKCSGTSDENKALKEMFKDVLISFIEDQPAGRISTSTGNELMIIGFHLPESSKETFNLRIDGNQFKSLLSAFKESIINISFKDDVLKISNKKTNLKMSTKDSEELFNQMRYIYIPKDSKVKVAELPQESLLSLIEEVLPLVENASKKEATPVFFKLSKNSVYAYSFTPNKAIASQGFAELPIPVEQETTITLFPESLKIFMHLLRVTKNNNYKIFVDKNGTKVEFKANAGLFVAAQANMEVPAISEIMKKIFNEKIETVEIDKEETFSALEKVKVIADNFTPVNVKIENNIMEISASSPTGSIKEKIEVKSQEQLNVELPFIFGTLKKALDSFSKAHPECKKLTLHFSKIKSGESDMAALLLTSKDYPKHIISLAGGNA